MKRFSKIKLKLLAVQNITFDIWKLAEEMNEEGYDIVNAEGTSHEDLESSDDYFMEDK